MINSTSVSISSFGAQNPKLTCLHSRTLMDGGFHGVSRGDSARLRDLGFMMREDFVTQKERQFVEGQVQKAGAQFCSA